MWPHSGENFQLADVEFSPARPNLTLESWRCVSLPSAENFRVLSTWIELFHAISRCHDSGTLQRSNRTTFAWKVLFFSKLGKLRSSELKIVVVRNQHTSFYVYHRSSSSPCVKLIIVCGIKNCELTIKSKETKHQQMSWPAGWWNYWPHKFWWNRKR